MERGAGGSAGARVLFVVLCDNSAQSFCPLNLFPKKAAQGKAISNLQLRPPRPSARTTCFCYPLLLFFLFFFVIFSFGRRAEPPLVCCCVLTPEATAFRPLFEFGNCYKDSVHIFACGAHGLS